MQGKKNYQEKLFISFQLSDYIPADNFYRRLNDILDLDFVYRATAKYYGREGQKSIDPVVFMKLMLVGYLENLSSDRKIVSTSRMRMDILYFLGYDLDEELPWHSTLSRTRQLYGMELFETLFKQVLKLCIDKGMVSGKRQAVDSAYIHANASMDSLVEREILKDASVYSNELNDNVEDGSMRIVPITKKPAKRVFDKSMPLEKRSNKTHGSLSDPEARISFKPGKAYRLTYTSQVSVDTAKHVITGIEAVLSDKRDSQCLPNLVERTVSNLKENGLVVDAILADTNYSSIDALKFMRDNAIDAYIPNAGSFRVIREGFEYEAENDRYKCHQGRYLPFTHHVKDRNGNINKIYSSKITECAGCPFLQSCAKSGRRKTIEDGIDRYLFDEMQVKMQSRKGKKMRKIRQSTVEPVLGSLINFTGMKRVNTKGLKQANKCMVMAAIAYNLKKLMKFSTKTPLTNVQAIPKNYKYSIWSFMHGLYILLVLNTALLPKYSDK